MTVYLDSPFAMTRYVSPQKTALTFDSLQLFSSFTQGGTIPFYVRYQYSWNLIETSKLIYGGFGPLDETVDKLMGTPGLRFIFNLAYAPNWWQAIDKNGNYVGYGASTAVLPDGPAMATLATKITNRYTNYINSGQIILQIGNEEYDTALNGAIGGKILAPTFNYAAQAIKNIAPNAIIIAGCIRPGAHPNGAGIQQWMNNFWTYVPKAGEPPQAIPYAHDFHFYDDSAVVTSAGYPAPDPTVTDNSSNPLSATKVAVQDVVSIMAGVLQTHSPSTQIWNLENGYSLPNNSPNNHNSAPSDLPSQQSRYTRDVMAQLQYANVGAKYAFYSVLDRGNDPRALNGQAITDYTNYVIANPQWPAASVPTQYLYQSVDELKFEGTTSAKPNDQYFSIMNPTNSNKAWSISSNQSWLTSVTIPTNGKNGTSGANLTSGTLTPGQTITLKCSANSTQNGLTQLTTQTGTLTITIGGNVSTITVSLFVTPTAANPNLTSGSAGPGNGPTFTMNVNGSAPANQTVTFKNADSYATWWYAFSTASWFSINNTSGTLAAGATQNIAISITGSVASNLAPGTYTEVLTISATPFPKQYTTDAIPANTQFITVIVKLAVQAAHSPSVAVQISTPSLYYTAVAGGSVPAAQPFYLVNCTNAGESWTATKTQSWLTLSKASGNLPAYGTTTGTSPNIQHTDYQVITASINTTGLSAGTHTDTITVTLGGTATQTIAVSYVVTSSGPTMIIGASPTSVSPSQIQGGTAVTATTTLTNSGNTTGTYTTTKTAGTTWLTVSPNTGTLTASGGTQVVTFMCTPGSLAAGTYNATVTFTLGTSTATVTVAFTVTAPSTISASLTSLALSQTQGGVAKTTSTTLSNSGASGTWTSAITYTNGTGWLAISPTTGTLGTNGTQVVTFTCTPGSLTPDTYTGYVIFTLGSSTVKVNVTFTVTPSSTPSLTASPTSLTLTQVQSGIAVTGTSTLTNTGSSGTWTSAITYTNGTGWLAISPTTGTIAGSGGTQAVVFTCTPGSLTPDTYTGYVVFTLGALTVKVNVTFKVTSISPPSISASPANMSFSDTVGVGGAVAQSITLTNPGGQTGSWTSTITYAKGANWTLLTPSTDTLTAGASEAVLVSMNDTSLKAGTYTATITFTVGSATAQVSVVLVMNPAQATSGTTQMTQGDLITQYQRIMASVVGPQLSILATTYYSNPTTGQIIYGELDALFPFETMSQLHTMKSITDVTAFLDAYAYVANVLFDNPIVYYRLGELSGVYAYDISGRKMTGVIAGLPALYGIVAGTPQAWLHVENGRIVDDSHQAVFLRGLNTAGLEFGDGVGTFTQARVSAFSQKFSINLWRVAINVAWWNSNVLMTDGVTHYKTWIQTVIGWMKANGCYVEIDPTTWITLPPEDSGSACSTNGLNPPQTSIGTDTFTRGNQSGWGTASDGSTWSTITGSPTLSISSNEGVMTATGGSDVYMKLGSGSAADQTGAVRFAITETTAAYAGVMLRFTNGNNWYRFYVDFASHLLVIDKLVSGSYASLGSISKTLVSGAFYWIRAYAVGTTLYVRLWQDGTTEPNSWDIQVTDSGLASGGVGVFGKTNTGDTVKFDSFATGTPITSCITHQDTLNFPPWTETQMVTATTTFFTDFITNYYPNDPAILYNVLNEPYPAPNYFDDPVTDNNTIINAIQTLQPKALIFVYGYAVDFMAYGVLSDGYTQSNLVIDFHTYDDYPSSTWQAKLAYSQPVFDYDREHQRASTIGEWNVNTTNDPQGFADAVASLVTDQGLVTTYYNADNVLNTDNITLTSEGQIVAITYQDIARGPQTYAATILAEIPHAYYRLDESSGTLALDSTGNGYDATLIGGTFGTDTFVRANQSGWGSATDGQAWTNLGTTATLSIASNEGVLTGAGGNDVYMKLGTGHGSDQEGLVRFALTISTFPYAGVMLRFTDTNNWYRCYVNSSQVLIDKLVGGSYGSLASASKTYTSGTFYWMRAHVVGTNLKVRTWADGSTEPSTWDVTATDSGLSSGGFGLFGKTNSGDSVKFDHFTCANPTDPATSSISYNQAGALVGDSDTSLSFSATAGLVIPSAILPILSLEYWTDIGGSTWHYVAMVKTGSATTLYLDGVVSTDSTNPVFITTNLDITKFASLTVPGRIDELAIYSEQLSAGQIRFHYQLGLAQTVSTGVVLGEPGALSASSDTSMLFDGVKGNIALPAGVNTANWPALTVECWINLSNITFTHTAFIVANDAPSVTNLGFMVGVKKNAVVFQTGIGGAYYELTQSFTFAAGTWYHLAAVFSGTALTAYVNGSRIGSTTVASALIAQTTNPVTIAARPGSASNSFPGLLDEASLCKAVVSTDRIQAHYLGRLNATSQTSYYSLIIADKPQAYYRMDETSGLVATDSSGNGYNATLSGMIVYGVAGIISSDTAMSFDSNGGLSLPFSQIDPSSWSALSLEYWINLTSGWQHIVIAGDANETTYYLNGAPYSSGSGSDVVLVDANVYFSGSYQAGALDEVALYNYVLSAAQVANHFQVGSLGV